MKYTPALQRLAIQAQCASSRDRVQDYVIERNDREHHLYCIYRITVARWKALSLFWWGAWVCSNLQKTLVYHLPSWSFCGSCGLQLHGALTNVNLYTLKSFFFVSPANRRGPKDTTQLKTAHVQITVSQSNFKDNVILLIQICWKYYISFWDRNDYKSRSQESSLLETQALLSSEYP